MSHQTPKILLADDSIAIQKVVHLTFVDEGFEVVTVGDGDTALAKLEAEAPDLVLADINMPGANGYKVCEVIRSRESTRDLPVILLAGSFEPYDQAEASRVGASTFLTKPFASIRDLVATVNRLLESSPRATDQAEPEASTQNGIEDIEGLYRQSFSSERGETDELTDSAFDDEMIETSSGADFNREPAGDFEIVTPLDTSQGTEAAAEGAGTAYSYEAEPFREIASPVAESAEEEASAESFGYDDLPATEEFTTEQKAEIHFRPVGDIPVGDETVRFEVIRDAVNAAAATSFDEINLLEIPPAGTEVEFTTSEAAAAVGSSKQVVSLSPELMEMIVQQVVERLSSK